MLTFRFKDGSLQQGPEGTRPRRGAQAVGQRLAKDSIAARVNGTIVDLDRELGTAPTNGGGASAQVDFALLTDKDPDALEVLRHSCAHIMARAVMRLFPGVKLAFGPATENGFYYDIDCDPPLREEEFPRIEEEMRKIVAVAEPFERFERPNAEALGLVRDLHQD